jgi:hypothetical protein
MPVEANVHFLNIDLLLIGRFDRRPLLAALRDDVFVLHDDAKFEGEDCLILEVQEPSLDLARTLARLVKWARGLAPAALRSWAAASRRIFDIGMQAGMKPHESHWRISPEQIEALAKLRAEVVLTVYGAEWNNSTPGKSRSTRRRGPRRPRGRAHRA